MLETFHPLSSCVSSHLKISKFVKKQKKFKRDKFRKIVQEEKNNEVWERFNRLKFVINIINRTILFEHGPPILYTEYIANTNTVTQRCFGYSYFWKTT